MNLSFGQRIDPQTGLVQSWFTHGALDEIAQMDLSDKVIVQYGSGMGDTWLAKRCKHLHCIERDSTWLWKSQEMAQNNNIENITYHYRPCGDSDGAQKTYCPLPVEDVDVIINDDAYRTEIVWMAVDYFKKRGGGLLICDNYWQDYVWKSPGAMESLEPFEKHIHLQPDHTDHEGEGWKTAIIFIK